MHLLTTATEIRRFSLILSLLLLACLSAVIAQERYEGPSITLESYSFNAKKRSSFTFNGQREFLQRGLTLIHFQSPEKFEYRTFDTYGSKDEATEAVTFLTRMQNDGVFFAVLAHDSATQGIFKAEAALHILGIKKLSALKGRQAYIMHNLGEIFYEAIDDSALSVDVTFEKGATDTKEYFPKEKYEFQPRVDRFIAHAGGELNGISYSNTREALDANYEKGFRLFELDIIETSDGKLVAAHDWNMWARFTDYAEDLPPSLSEFKKHTIYGKYHTLDMDGINTWFKAHPDAVLVTDKLNDPLGFAKKFVDKNRLIMELFSPISVEEASSNGLKAMISQEVLFALKGDKLNYLQVNNVTYVAVSRRIISQQTKLFKQLRDAGIKVYVYNVNFDPGKDEKYVYANEIGLVYGMYADKWNFSPEDKTPTK